MPSLTGSRQQGPDDRATPLEPRRRERSLRLDEVEMPVFAAQQHRDGIPIRVPINQVAPPVFHLHQRFVDGQRLAPLVMIDAVNPRDSFVRYRPASSFSAGLRPPPRGPAAPFPRHLARCLVDLLFRLYPAPCRAPGTDPHPNRCRPSDVPDSASVISALWRWRSLVTTTCASRSPDGPSSSLASFASLTSSFSLLRGRQSLLHTAIADLHWLA